MPLSLVIVIMCCIPKAPMVRPPQMWCKYSVVSMFFRRCLKNSDQLHNRMDLIEGCFSPLSITILHVIMCDNQFVECLCSSPIEEIHWLYVPINNFSMAEAVKLIYHSWNGINAVNIRMGNLHSVEFRANIIKALIHWLTDLWVLENNFTSR